MTIKDIGGIVAFANKMMQRTLTVRFTSDSLGESISIADEVAGIMLEVPFEQVAEIIAEERKRNDKAGS